MATLTDTAATEIRRKIRDLQVALVRVSMSQRADRQFRHQSLLHSLKLARKQLISGNRHEH